MKNPEIEPPTLLWSWFHDLRFISDLQKPRKETLNEANEPNEGPQPDPGTTSAPQNQFRCLVQL